MIDPSLLKSTADLSAIQTNFVSGTPGKDYADSVLEKYQAPAGKLGQITPFSGGITPATDVPIGDSRYPYFSPFVLSNEELYAGYQSWYEKAGHGLLKGAGLAGTTFLNGTLGLIVGMGQAIADGKFSSFYDNDFSRALDDWNTSMEQQFANYYTKREQDAAWYSPDNLLTANFLFDKVIKNLGFSVGAIGAGMTYAGALRAIGLFSKVASAGGLARTAELTEQAISSVPHLQRGGAVTSAIQSASNEFLANFNIHNTAQRAIAGGLATAGEASIEALMHLNAYRQQLINDYVVTHGIEPTGEDMEDINRISERAGNAVFGLNALLLAATNYVQFPKILGSSYRAERKLYNSVLQDAGEITFDRRGGSYVADLPRKGIGKALYKAKNISGLLFSPSEAVEEFSQTAFGFGVDNYFDKARTGKDADFIRDVFGEGYYRALTTKEGMESLLIGGFSGGLFEFRGKLAERGLTGMGGTRGTHRTTALGALNKNLFTGYLKDSLKSVKRSAILQAERAEAIRRGDIQESKDLENDYAHNYLAPRIKYGRYDLIHDDVSQYRMLAATDEGFQQLKTQGLIDEHVTKEQFMAHLDNFARHATHINTLYQSLGIRYGGVKNEKGQSVYPPEVIDKMVYAASKVANYDIRVPQLSERLLAQGINVQPILDSITLQDRPSTQAVTDATNQIRNLDVLPEIKDQLRTELRDLAELTLRRKHFLKEYDQLKGTPTKNIQEKYGETGIEPTPAKLEVPQRSESGELTMLEVEPGKRYQVDEGIVRAGDKLIPFAEMEIHEQNLLEELRITLPDGAVTFWDAEDFKATTLTEPLPVVERDLLRSIFNKRVGEILATDEYKSLVPAKLPDSFESKIELVNTVGSPALSQEVEQALLKETSDFGAIRAQIQTIVADSKEAKDFKAPFEEMAKSAGQVATGDPTEEKGIPATGDSSAKKHISILFRSSTSEATYLRGTGENDDFHRRANKFLAGIEDIADRQALKVAVVTSNNQESLGLSGLIPEKVPGTDTLATDTDEGIIRLVFIRTSPAGDHFIDMAGENLEPVGQQPDFSKLVYTTLPSTSLQWRNGETRYITTGRNAATAATAQSYQAGWKIKRTALLSRTTGYDTYAFMVSRGFASYEPGKQRSVVGHFITDTDLLYPVITIPTRQAGEQEGKPLGSIIHNEETIDMPLGRPVLQNGSLLFPLNNRRLTSREREVIKKLIKQIAFQPQKERAQPGVFDYLRSVLFYKVPGDDSKVSSNQFWFSKGFLYLGSRAAKIPLIESAVDASDVLDNFLENAFFSVNNFLLTQKFGEPYNEIVDVSEDGNIRSVQWKSYQHFLLDDKFTTTVDDTSGVSGKRPVDEVPLTTDIQLAGHSSDPYAAAFEQKYIILKDFGLFPHVPAPEKKSTDPVSDSEYKAYVDKGLVSEGLLGAIAQKIMDRQALSAREQAIFQGRTGDINYFIAKVSASKPAVMESPATTPEPQQVEPITRAGNFILDGTTLNDITYKNKKLARVAASLTPAGIVFGTYEHIGKKALTPEHQEAVLQLATSMISEALVAEASKRLEAQSGSTASSAGNVTASAVAPVDPASIPQPVVEPATPDHKTTVHPTTVEDIFKNLRPRSSPGDISGGQFRMIDWLEQPAEDWAKLEKYLGKVLPQVPVQVLRSLIRTTDGGYAWGMFRDGAIFLSEQAALGTGYHEAFEAVYNMFLRPDQRAALYEEFGRQQGQFTDRETGLTVAYSQASEHQAKEHMAEQFRHFVLTGELPKPVGRRGFFARLWAFIKTLLGGGESHIRKLFTQIDQGYYARFPVPADRGDQSVHYSIIPGLNTSFIHQSMQGITALLFDEIFKTNESIVRFDEQSITFEQLYGAVFERLEAYYQETLPSQLLMDIEQAGLPQKEADRAKQLYADFMNSAWTPIKQNWQDLIRVNREFLKKFNIVFETDEEVDPSETSINSQGKNDREYDRDILRINARKNASAAVKLLFATLTEVDAVTDPQASLATLATPQRKLSPLKLPILINYAHYFNKLLYQLAGTNTMSDGIEKIQDLARTDSTYIRLVNRLKIGAGYDNLSLDDWKLLLKLYAVGNKQRPAYFIQQTDETGRTYLIGADQNIQTKKVISGWLNNLKVHAGAGQMVIVDQDRYRINQAVLEKLPIKSVADKISFLQKMGIVFDERMYERLTPAFQRKFNDGAQGLYSQLKRQSDVATISGRALGVSGPLNKIAEAFVAATGETVEPQHFNVAGEPVQNLVLQNYASIILHDINRYPTREALLDTLPHLKDIFTSDSLLLEAGGPLYDDLGVRRPDPITPAIVEGKASTDTRQGTPTSKLNLAARRLLEFNNNLNGIYHLLVPADSKTEWALDLQGFQYIPFSDFANKGALSNKIFRIFSRYLLTELELAGLYEQRRQVKAIADQGRQLRFFNNVFGPGLRERVGKHLEKGGSHRAWIEENRQEIRQSIQEWIDARVAEQLTYFLDNQIITRSFDGNLFFPGLDSDFMEKEKIGAQLTEGVIRDIITFRTLNYSIQNIEFHKLFFGDPALYTDATKRIKSFLSGREITYHTDTALNEHAHRHLNLARGPLTPVPLQPGDPGFHTFRDYMPTVTAADVVVVGAPAMDSGMPPDLIKEYEKANEADAQSWMQLTAYRELLLKAGARWTEAMERQFQYEYAYERSARARKGSYRYTDQSLQEADEALLSSDNPTAGAFYVIKPIGAGVKYGATFADIFLDKTSTVPLFYRLVEGTALETVYLQMQNQDVAYLITASGRKVGNEGEHPLYQPDGTINPEVFNNKVNVPFKYYGIQVETSSHSATQIRGSQLTKIATINLMQHGVPADYENSLDDWYQLSEQQKREASPIYRLVAKNKEILDALTERGYREVLGRLGIEENADGFDIPDFQKVVELLQREVSARDLPDDLKQAIAIDPDTGLLKVPMDALRNAHSLKSIIYSVVDRYLLSPRMNGGPKVQVSATMFERNKRQAVYKPGGDLSASWQVVDQYDTLTDREKGTVRLSSGELKFYAPDRPYMEVLLPHWFKEKLQGRTHLTDQQLLDFLNRSDSPLLTGVGFRIPTQAPNSVERFKVKGFLPAEIGDTIVVPTEITVKAGSDFDIDKLNTYLKNFEIDNRGFPVPVVLQHHDTSSEQGLKALYEEFRLYRGVRASEQRRFSDQAATQLINQLFGADLTIEIEALDSLEDFIAENKGKNIYELYGRYKPAALENEYMQTLEELISLPVNYRHLIQPNSALELKMLRDELHLAMGKTNREASGDFARLLDPMYMSEVRHNFLTGKDGVGIAALQQTNTALNQLTGVLLDHRAFASKLSEGHMPYVQNMHILLPHNTVEIGGEKFVSISGVRDTIGNYISDKISAYINGYVDVAKDPFIIELGANLNVASTYMFLEKIGVPTRDVIFFMAQPIIRDYLQALEIKGFTSPISASASKIIGEVKGKYPTTKRAVTTLDAATLKANIEKNAAGIKFSSVENATQQLILDEFIKYSVFADHLFKLTQGTNYDTANFSDPALIFRKQQQTAQARESNLFSSVDKVLEGSFLGRMADRLSQVKSAMGALFFLDQPSPAAIMEQVLKDYVPSQFAIAEEDYLAIARKLQASILDFIIQTSDKNIAQQPLHQKISTLLLAQNSVAAELAAVKRQIPEDSQLAGNIILKQLQPILDNVHISEPKNIALLEKPHDSYTYNRYTEAMRELRENIHTQNLYKKLVELSLLQSGTKRNLISFSEIIPMEDYVPYLQQAINSPSTLELLALFPAIRAFQRANWADDRIVPTLVPRTLETREGSWQPLYAVPSRLFTNLGIQSRSEYDFIQLHSRYQSRDLQFPVVKIRQIAINPATGKIFTPQQQAEMRKNGDYSFFTYKLYQRVEYKDSSGETRALSYPDLDARRPGAFNVIYKQINAWGKPGAVQEYYDQQRPSVLPSNIKIQEFTDNEVVAAFMGKDSTYLQLPAYPEQDITPSKAGAATLDKIYDFLEKMGVAVDLVKKINVEGRPIAASGIADITRRLIEVVEGKVDTTLPEEAMHFVVEIIEQKHPMLMDRLMNRIGRFKILNQIMAQYGNTASYMKDGKPDVKKLKKEAIARVLVETIIRKEEGGTENPELMAEVASWWQQVLEWLKRLFGKAGGHPFVEAAEVMEQIRPGDLPSPEGEREGGAFFLQQDQSSQQHKLSENLLKIHGQLSKVSSPDNPNESHYELNGKEVKNRVTNLAKKYYEEKFRNKQIGESELQKALNDQKREKGNDGHLDLERIFHRYVDDQGFIRDEPLPQMEPSQLDPNDNSFYLTLEQNLKERLHAFPPGTRFFSEVMIYDKAKDEAGTIDFLAIEPDTADRKPGKIHILDWKFISLKTGATDVPWYKKEAWNIQISEYIQILTTPDYGANKKDFGLTRAIPIKATYTFDKIAKDRLVLYSLEIGRVNVKLIEDDTLLPVPTRHESTGNKQLDNLIASLNNLAEKIYETRSEPGKEYQKIDRLNDLVTAIRRLHLKQEIKDLYDFAKADIKRLNAFYQRYHDILESDSQEQIAKLDLNDLSAQILDADDVLSIYRELGKAARKIFDPFLETNKSLLREAEIIADGADIVHDKFIALAGLLRTNPIARGAGVTDLLTPEKSVTWYQRWVRSLSQGATKATSLLWNIVNAINTKVQVDFAEENERLKKVEREVSAWIRQQGKKFADLEDMLLAKDDKGRWNGRVIAKTAQEYYTALSQAKLKNDKEWVYQNVDLEAYQQWYEDAYQKRKDSYASSRLLEDDLKDDELKKKRLELFEKQYDIFKYPASAISQANLRLNSYPDLQKWKSVQYAKLLEPENKPVLELYEYWEKRLEESYELGMIKAWDRKTFFPNVRKDFLDKMVFGSRNAQYRTANLGFLDTIRIDVDDAVYGYTDFNGNPQDRLSALYVYDIGQKVTAEDGEEFSDYSNKSTDLFKVMALWNKEMIKFRHKSEVVDIVRLLHFTEKNRKAIGRSKKTGAMAVKADGEPVLVDNVENTTYFKNYMDYYFYGKRLSQGQDVTFQLQYNKLADKVNKVMGTTLMPKHSEEVITISGKKMIAATNRYFQMKVLGLNVATAITNFLGGKANAYMLAGRHFTRKDYAKASLQLASGAFHTKEGKVYAGLLNYFLPLTEDRTREQIRDLSVSKTVKYLSSDHLFYLMRTSDKLVQLPAAIAFFDNTMVQDGKLVNIREYVKQQNGYDLIYRLSSSEQKALRKKIEEEIETLKNTRSLPKVTTIVDDKVQLPGIERKDSSVISLRNRIQQFSKDALGNMSEDDISQYRMTLLGQSFMMFKNWIPRMADVRFSEFRYQPGTESYEWGRVAMLFHALRQGVLNGAGAVLGTLLGKNASLINIAKKIYVQKKGEIESGGEIFKMSEADFIDMYLKGVRTQLKEVALMTSMIALLLFAKADSPDDDDVRAKGAYKWIVRTLDKLTDELGFFLNPLSFTAIANGSVFPSVQVLNDLVMLMKGLNMEGYYLVIGDEEAREKNKVAKYLFKTFPVTKELMMYTAIFNEELAREYGISISTNARRR